MIIFSEGVPRSGKSYDAVKSHIIPALKKRRRVIARLNGLNHEKIAEYLGISCDECRDLLHIVDTDKVRQTFVATMDDGVSWRIDDKFRNALIVIDEVHEFYVGGGKEQLPPQVEQFFALHGHYGIDLLLLTQFYKRLHLAIRARIERKASFQKLSVMGKVGESSYRVTHWQTVAPDRYEKIGGETKKYDAKIFPLYSGYASDDADAVVYSEGRINVWRPIIIRGMLIVPVAIAAFAYLIHFFTGGGAEMLVTQPAAAAAPPLVVDQPFQPTAIPVPANQQQPAIAQTAMDAINPPTISTPPQPILPSITADEFEDMTPEQKFVFQLSAKSRLRYGGTLYGRLRDVDLLEWYDDSGEVRDRMTADQVRSLGVDVKRTVYGLRLRVGDEVLVATQWPITAPVRESRPQLYNTAGGAPSDVREQREPTADDASSDSSASSNEPLGYGRIAAYGDMSTAPPGTNSSDIE